MVITETLPTARTAESRGKFVNRLPEPKNRRHPAPVSSDLPIVPKWVGWR